jgi:DNA replication ATP-dependent helicase Dna2
MNDSPDLIDGRYRIVRRLGSGGYGSVYLAQELASEALFDGERPPLHDAAVLREVAVKILNEKPIDRHRFVAEVTALCRLNHPGIVTVLNYGRADSPYVVMEYVQGVPLDERLGEHRLGDIQSALRLFIQIADALGHAHARGVVHRDLKPPNVIIDAQGQPRLVDFGLSWLVVRGEPTTARIGTPGFLAPELMEDDYENCDHRADIYSLGATIFAVFTGYSPFAAHSSASTLRRQLSGDFEFPGTFPSILRPIVARCLERDPHCRPRSVSIVADELRRIAHAFADSNTETPEGTPAASGAHLDIRSAIVEDTQPFTHPSFGDGIRLYLASARSLEGHTGTGGSQIRAFAYKSAAAGRDARMYDALSMLWKGSEIHVLDGEVRADREGNRFLRLAGEADIVIEPYFPVTITEVAETEGVRAAACPTRALIDLRKPPAFSPAITAGSIAHAALEILVQHDQPHAPPTWDEVFAQVVPQQRIELVAAGVTDTSLLELRNTLRHTYNQLVEWTLPGSDLRHGHLAESKRFSTRYGLEGRIDLATNDDETLRIFELKTGSQQPSNEAQLRGYLLLWEEFARQNEVRIEGSLLFSKDARRQAVTPHASTDRSLLGARNALVGMRRWLADGHSGLRPPSFGDFPERCSDSACRWRRDECRSQTRRLGSMSASEKDVFPTDVEEWRGFDPALVHVIRTWYTHMVRLIEREYRAMSTTLGDTLRRSTLEERIASHDAIDGVSILSMNVEQRTLIVRCEHHGSFALEDRLVLRRGDMDAGVVITGEVTKTQSAELTLRTASSQDPSLLHRDGWILEREVPRIGYRDMHRALWGFVTCGDPSRVEPLVMPHRFLSQRYALPEPPEDLSASLNYEQRQAVLRMVSDAPWVLVQGPPGTGKTHVIAEAVWHMVQQGKRVLIAACTNTAVDNALARIVARGCTRVLRVQSSSRATPELRNALQQANLPFDKVFSVDMGRRTDSLDQIRTEIGARLVVAATANACTNSAVFHILEQLQARQAGVGQQNSASTTPSPVFDVVIIDEASQLVEPLALAAVRLARRVVMVGDPQQLPPVVTAADARTESVEETIPKLLLNANIGGLDKSLFQRMQQYWTPTLLRVQYRMNSHIQEFPSQAFYNGLVQPAPDVANRRFPIRFAECAPLDAELRRRLDPEYPCVWVDAGDSTATGNRHPAEVREIIQTVQGVVRIWRERGESLPPDLLGIVSPYRAQCFAIRAALRDTLREEEWKVIEVETADRFQGREKEAILISLVATDWSDFVMDARRLNVTLTRARTKLIVFGARAVGRRMFEVYQPRPSGLDLSEGEREQGTLL